MLSLKLNDNYIMIFVMFILSGDKDSFLHCSIEPIRLH